MLPLSMADHYPPPPVGVTVPAPRADFIGDCRYSGRHKNKPRLVQREKRVSLHEPGLAHRKQLLRGIGLAGAAIVVLNGVIGAGIFALPALADAPEGQARSDSFCNGLASPLSLRTDESSLIATTSKSARALADSR